MNYRVHWRDYSVSKYTYETTFPGLYQIGEATRVILEYRQFFCGKGRSLEFWLEPT